MTPRNTILLGDALRTLRSLPSESVNCVVTSPPYWNLRDYGVPGQYGLEATLDDYLHTMVAVFEEVRRVLCTDGTLWLNMGDSYGAQQGAGFNTNAYTGGTNRVQEMQRRYGDIKLKTGLKPKDLIGLPWRVAFALQTSGWYLRSDIVWHKPNPMPESVQDRPTRAHEYLFLMARSQRYYYDAGAIRDPLTESTVKREKQGYQHAFASQFMGSATDKRFTNGKQLLQVSPVQGANKRSVWTMATQPFAQAHFATFPEALIEPCIMAGSRPGDLVLDPFIGSGTVGVVCRRLGRDYLGIEINPAYVEMAESRIAKVLQPMLLYSPRAAPREELTS